MTTFTATLGKATLGTALLCALAGASHAAPVTSDVLDVTLTEQNDSFIVPNNANSRVRGLGGNDSIIGGTGMDIFIGNLGNDSLVSGAGADTLLGGPDNDSLVSGPGADILKGGPGNDSVVGGEDDDILFGGKGDDSLVGGLGNDQVTGGAGIDELAGEGGTDTLTGGPDADTFIFNADMRDAGIHTVTEFTPGTDKVAFQNREGHSVDFIQDGRDVKLLIDGAPAAIFRNTTATDFAPFL